ncbi:hypothetical protein [Armatimonas sp.]|uniref:hypothetical protein n=1 Tax=Armatimonas sp. TaxID=1872638 RepID=UPI0037517E40
MIRVVSSCIVGILGCGRRHSGSHFWFQAGNFLRSLELCDKLTATSDAPEALRERRDRLWAELLPSEHALVPA